MKKIVIVTFILLLLFILIYSMNFYFLSRLSNQVNNSSKLKLPNTKTISDRINKLTSSEDFEKKANNFFKSNLKSYYKTVNPKFHLIRKKLIRNFQFCDYQTNNLSVIWNIANKWPKKNEIYPEYDENMCKIIKSLQTAKILNAKNSPKGTQLKLEIKLDGNQGVIFKPSWYTRDEIIEMPIYSGKDRHNAEIIAFYLGAILDRRWTPIAVGRKINLKEIFNIGDTTLQETMVLKNNETKLCMFGKCFYCKPSELVCGDNNHWLEGVILYVIPGPIQKFPSPWQRTYDITRKAIWEEKGPKYCEYVKKKLGMERILDLIDASVFDFLIQNGDRHHYETRYGRILFMDNGKGFGNSNIDAIDILAPLYQCCMIREKMWQTLQIFTGGSLTNILKELTKTDQLYPILTEQHYKALERRLLKLFGIIEY